MEIEAKFRALQRIKPGAVEQIDWTPYHLGPRVVHMLHDTLLDSPHRTITDALHALRVRHDGLHVYLTFKGPGTTSAGVHRREEIEELIDPAVAETPEHWPPSIRQRVQELAGDLMLEPIVEVQNKRRSWQIWSGSRLVAELALDRGDIQAGNRAQPLNELELELKGDGTEDDLLALTERLRHALMLVDEPQSKLARGLQLLKASSSKAEKIRMTPTADLAEAGRTVLRKHWRTLLDNEDGARAGDMEAVHDMRVATRRLRAMLEVLTVVYDPRTVARLRKGLRRLAAALGAVRDADVWIAAVDAYTDGRSLEERTGLMPLMQVLIDRRDAGRRRLLRELDAEHTSRLRDAVEEFVSTPGMGTTSDDLAVRVRDRAGSALWMRYEELRAFEPVMPIAPVDVLHEVRIAGKHLRYTLELFKQALGEDAEGLLRELVDAQDHLGALHDADLGIALADTLLAEDANEALHAYRHHLEATVEEERRQAEAVWERLHTLFGQRLAALIAAL